MNDENNRQDEVTESGIEKAEETVDNISENIEDDDLLEKISEIEESIKNENSEDANATEDIPFDEKDIVEADPYEQMTRDQADFMRRKELVSNHVEMYDEKIPYEKGLPPREKTINFCSELFSWAESITAAVLIICLLFAFAVRTIGVIGPSMQNTLFENDRLIVSKIAFEPKYGDIVIISKKNFREDSIVKRIIATEGQTVNIDFELGNVYVDGECLEEVYIKEPTYRQWDVQFPVTVPENCVFVMGDNRNNSTDSRDSDVGMVNEQEILGRVLCRFWPLNALDIFKRFE